MSGCDSINVDFVDLSSVNSAFIGILETEIVLQIIILIMFTQMKGFMTHLYILHQLTDVKTLSQEKNM